MPDTSRIAPQTHRRSLANPAAPAARKRRISGLKAVVADDSVLLREGIVRLLEDSGVEVVGQAGDAEDLLRKVRVHRPDVAVVDVRMPPTHTSEGLTAAMIIREQMPDVGVLMLSQFAEDGYASDVLSDNAAGFGYLLKDRVVDVAQFLDAFARVANGGTALDPEIVSRMVGRSRRNQGLDGLSERELEVLALMAEGRSNHAISERLVISVRATEKHVTRIFQKLGLQATMDDHRRVLAVLEYMQRR